MLSGVLTSESLTQAFRVLSQRRRHGVLEISCDLGQFEIYFANGKIVGSASKQDPVCVAICRKLVLGGRLSEDIAQSAGQSWEEVGALYEMLVGAEIVPEDDFCSAKQSYEMDILYSLRKAQNGFINFQPQVLDMDSELSLLVAPGQLLLDMVELESEDSVFTHRFGELSSETTILTRVCDVGTEMSKEEAVVWKCVDAATCLKELSEAALLSEYQIREALCSLCDQGFLEVVKDAERLAGTPLPAEISSPAINAGSNIDTLVDKAAELLHGIDESAKAEEPLQSVDGSDVDRAQSLAKNNLDGEELEGGELQDLASEFAERFAAELKTETDVPGEKLPLEKRQIAEEEISEEAPEVRPAPKKRASLFRGAFFIEDLVLERIALIFSMLFLLAVALVFPGWIENWFAELSSFATQ